MAVNEALATRVRSVLANEPNVEERKMFGGIAFMVAGHMCCGVHKENLMVRVGPDAHPAALKRPHARPMDITGRPMKSMVFVDPNGFAGEDDLRGWVHAGLAYVRSLPPKQRARGRLSRSGLAFMTSDTGYLDFALVEAETAAARGEVPVGAVVVEGATGRVLACAGNRVEALNDPAAHAEILALRAAGAALGTPRLFGCDLYVNLEPCAMCAQAIALARVRRLFFGAYDPKGGGVDHGARIYQQPTCHHRPEVVGGLDEARCATLLRSYFGELRER